MSWGQERSEGIKYGGDAQCLAHRLDVGDGWVVGGGEKKRKVRGLNCLLYTSDAADEGLGVDLGGRRIIKKKKI